MYFPPVSFNDNNYVFCTSLNFILWNTVNVIMVAQAIIVAQGMYIHVHKWPICLALLLSLQIDSVHPPNVNCQDMVGNTPLHCAAYR